jgi:ADP-heptose:LPS heptosyltransferase
MILHYDCRHFLGHRPCRFKRECEDCPHYLPFGRRILIIKLGATGDVLRTTPLLRGLRQTDSGCHITWLTEPGAVPMLQGIPEIDRLLPCIPETAVQLGCETFDDLFCFDKEPKATALATKLTASHKAGFGMSRFGNVMPLSAESEYAFELGINDTLKFRLNTKTYPELIFECARLPYRSPQEYLFPDLSREVAEARRWLQGSGVETGVLKIGLNTGAGDAFAAKKWSEEGYAGLAELLIETTGARILLLGGPAEVERNARIQSLIRHPVVHTGNHNPIRAFAGLVGNCNLVVTGDTLAMHVAIGLKVPVVVLFGPTCHQEIELYGRGEKIVSDFDCSPCYLSTCPKEVTCMQAIPAARVLGAVLRVLAQSGWSTGGKPAASTQNRASP